MDLGPLFLTFEVATIATFVAAVVGIAVAAVLSSCRFAGRDVVDVVFTAPLVMPPTVLGYYLLVALGRNSVIGHAYEALTGDSIVFTRTGAVIAAAVGALPLVVKSVRAALEQIDPTLILAARTLGATRVRAFFSVELPLAKRGIAAALMLAFARASGDFGVTLMVAGDIPGKTRTASLAIYNAIQAQHEREATVMVMILTALVLALLYGVTVLFGPSGAGKSRTLGCIAGIVRPDRGRIALGQDVWFDDARGARGTVAAIHERRVAYVFQSLALFPHMTAEENVAYGVGREIPAAERRAHSHDMLARMRVGHLAGRKPQTYSGGEAQRVALARAFAMKPRVLLLDEPFSALDAGVKRELLEEVREWLGRERIPAILVTHQADEATALGQHVVLLEKGRVREARIDDATLALPQIRAAAKE